MTNSTRNVLFILVIVITIMILGTLNAEGCNGNGNCAEPLPTHAVTRACDGPGVGPEHKCNPTQAESTSTLASTAVPPTATSVAPTATKVQPVYVPPTASPTPTATATVILDEPSLGSCIGEVCLCQVVQQSLEAGLVVVIGYEVESHIEGILVRNTEASGVTLINISGN